MIDLRYGLPNSIIGNNGEPILLETDYRVWLQFMEDMKREDIDRDVSYLFANEPPIIDERIYNQLIMFLFNPSVTPRSEEASGEKVLDYIMDGEYIFSALYKVYGIDIVDMEMHWHKFQALCNNVIGDDTLWGYAKSMRGYNKPSKSETQDRIYTKAKEVWSFPITVSEEVQEKVEEFDNYFG